MSERTNPMENRGPLQQLLADGKVWGRARKSPLGAYRLLLALQVAAECADRLADEMVEHECPEGQETGDDEPDCRLCDFEAEANGLRYLLDRFAGSLACIVVAPDDLEPARDQLLTLLGGLRRAGDAVPPAVTDAGPPKPAATKSSTPPVTRIGRREGFRDEPASAVMLVVLARAGRRLVASLRGELQSRTWQDLRLNARDCIHWDCGLEDMLNLLEGELSTAPEEGEHVEEVVAYLRQRLAEDDDRDDDGNDDDPDDDPEPEPPDLLVRSLGDGNNPFYRRN